MGLRAILVVLGVTFAASADPPPVKPGQVFAHAFAKKDGKAAQKVLSKTWKYGLDGRDQAPTAPVDKFLSGLFKTLTKATFTEVVAEASDCTQAGRELGFIAGQLESNSSLADWVRGIPAAYCGEGEPPTFWIVKRLDLEQPHAAIIVESGGEYPEVVGFYHF